MILFLWLIEVQAAEPAFLRFPGATGQLLKAADTGVEPCTPIHFGTRAGSVGSRLTSFTRWVTTRVAASIRLSRTDPPSTPLSITPLAAGTSRSAGRTVLPMMETCR